MGIAIMVESIVYPPSYPPIAPQTIQEARWYAERWQFVVQISETFGWHKFPWEEPSSYRSNDIYTCNNSKYDLLRAVAFTIGSGKTWTNMTSAWALAHDQSQPVRFPHLSLRNDSGYTALYLPTDIPLPRVLPSTSAWEHFTVGSSVRLHAETQELLPIIHSYVEEYGSNTVVNWAAPAGAAAHTWSALEDICTIIQQYTYESIEHRVPLFISW